MQNSNQLTVEQFEQVMTFGSDDAIQKKWKAFCRKIDTETDDYDTVLKTIKSGYCQNGVVVVFSVKEQYDYCVRRIAGFGKKLFRSYTHRPI